MYFPLYQLKNHEIMLKGINEIKYGIWLNSHSIQLQVNGADENRIGEHGNMRRTLYEHGYGGNDDNREYGRWTILPRE